MIKLVGGRKQEGQRRLGRGRGPAVEPAARQGWLYAKAIDRPLSTLHRAALCKSSTPTCALVHTCTGCPMH